MIPFWLRPQTRYRHYRVLPPTMYFFLCRVKLHHVGTMQSLELRNILATDPVRCQWPTPLPLLTHPGGAENTTLKMCPSLKNRVKYSGISKVQDVEYIH